MKALQRSEYARASRIRDGRMHRGKKSVTRQAWIHKGDDKPGAVKHYSGTEAAWLLWNEGKPTSLKPAEKEAPWTRMNRTVEKAWCDDRGVYMKCPRGFNAKSVCGQCAGAGFFTSCIREAGE